MELKESNETIRRVNDNLNELNRQLANQVMIEVERRQHQERILTDQKKFADMGSMMSAIAHQWRQPLNALGLILQSIDSAESLEDPERDLISQGIEIIQHLSHTIDDFRNYFTPDREKEHFSVVNAVMSVFRLVSASLKNSGIDFIIRCSCNESNHESHNDINVTLCAEKKQVIYGFPGEFKQVLLNIISNARDALLLDETGAGAGSKIITATITRRETLVQIVIHNNGPAIADDNLDRIFNPYFTTRLSQGGTGVGLYMARLIIEDHMGGTMSALNTESGVAFTLTLPLSETRA